MAFLDPEESKMQGREIPLVPGNATLKIPDPAPTGMVNVLNGESDTWELVEDHRGEEYWLATGEKVVITATGPIPENLIATAPASAYDEWNGTLWVKNTAKWLDGEVRPLRNKLLDEVDIKHCNASNWEDMTASKRQEWKTYKKALKDLPDTINPENPVWPTRPA